MEASLEKKPFSFNWPDLYFKPIYYPCGFVDSRNTSKLNLKSFRAIINKLKELKEENVINEKQFSDILILLATNYIETEVELRVTDRVNETMCTLFEKS